MTSLPFDAELHPAKSKRFRETFLLVHHFGGSPKKMRRHTELFNDLGFDVITFQLLANDIFPLDKRVPITGDLKFGAKYVWAGQIEAILNAVTGPKMLFSFSMPSLAALDAISKRRAKDVSGWVCDGGPFLDLFNCTWRLLEHERRIDNPILRSLATAYAYPLFGIGAEADVARDCKLLPKMFPVLSIRGEKDPMVPIAAIEEVFQYAPQIELVRYHLKEGKHLDGIKNHLEKYRAGVEPFLRQHATPL